MLSNRKNIFGYIILWFNYFLYFCFIHPYIYPLFIHLHFNYYKFIYFVIYCFYPWSQSNEPGAQVLPRERGAPGGQPQGQLRRPGGLPVARAQGTRRVKWYGADLWKRREDFSKEKCFIWNYFKKLFILWT